MLALLLLAFVALTCVSIWIAFRFNQNWLFGFFAVPVLSIFFMYVWGTLADVLFEMNGFEFPGISIISTGIAVGFSPITALIAVLAILIRSRREKTPTNKNYPDQS